MNKDKTWFDSVHEIQVSDEVRDVFDAWLSAEFGRKEQDFSLNRFFALKTGVAITQIEFR